MRFIEEMKEKAKSNLKTIILPESDDERVLKAAVNSSKEKVAKIILLGKEEDCQAVCPDLDFTGVTFVDPETSPEFDRLAEGYSELRKHKGMTPEKAREAIKDKTTFGMMMMKFDLADGLVSGAVNSTANTLRPALQILRTKEGTKLVSAFFVMVTKTNYGKEGLVIFADSGLNEDPDAEAISEIAIASAESYRFFTQEEPRVAMLSYSSYGSAKSHLTEKMVEATKLAQEKAPELLLDGELQVDAALNPATSAKKAPGNKVEGKANVFIFPDLNAGNIAYKLVQYFGGAEAYGPLLQGIAKPVNDLSRGCTSEDIEGVIAITSVQAALA